MGTAANKRRLNRLKYLKKLAKNDPRRFDEEWEKRLSSWLELIRLDAGRLKDQDQRDVQPVFDRVDEIMGLLWNCGAAIYQQYAEETFDLLSAECCRQFGIKVEKGFYHLNHYLEAPQSVQDNESMGLMQLS